MQQLPTALYQGAAGGQDAYLGHDLWRGFGFVVYRRCCYYAASLSRKLSQPCLGPVRPKVCKAEARRASRRDAIMSGTHPLTGRPL